MEWLYKLGDKVLEVGNSANAKAKDIAELAKLNSKIRTYEAEIQKNYEKIGAEIFATRLETDVNHDFEDEFQEIIDKMEGIANCREMICEIKGTMRCSVCGAEVEKNAYFCKKCGARMEQTEDKY